MVKVYQQPFKQRIFALGFLIGLSLFLFISYFFLAYHIFHSYLTRSLPLNIEIVKIFLIMNLLPIGFLLLSRKLTTLKLVICDGSLVGYGYLGRVKICKLEDIVSCVQPFDFPTNSLLTGEIAGFMKRMQSLYKLFNFTRIYFERKDLIDIFNFIDIYDGSPGYVEFVEAIRACNR